MVDQPGCRSVVGDGVVLTYARCWVLLEVISKTMFQQEEDAAQLGESEEVLGMPLVAHH